MTEKATYEPPRARSLTATTATGQEPLGICTTGYYPYVGCNTGAHLGVGQGCAPGSVPDFGDECFPLGTTATNDCTAGLYA